jgi:hypothetical protein
MHGLAARDSASINRTGERAVALARRIHRLRTLGLALGFIGST